MANLSCSRCFITLKALKSGCKLPHYATCMFLSSNRCFSTFGMIGGRQKISIGRGCEHKAIVQHEILHALGRVHEQSRPDRDEFVFIDINNVISGM